MNIAPAQREALWNEIEIAYSKSAKHYHDLSNPHNYTDTFHLLFKH